MLQNGRNYRILAHEILFNKVVVNVSFVKGILKNARVAKFQFMVLVFSTTTMIKVLWRDMYSDKYNNLQIEENRVEAESMTIVTIH